MTTLQRKLAEIRELQAEELEQIGGGVYMETGQPVVMPTMSIVQTPNGGQLAQDDAGVSTTDYIA